MQLRHSLFLLPLAACASTSSTTTFVTPGELDEHARELAQRFIILDGHIDVPYRLENEMEDVGLRTEKGQFDHPRAVAGGLDAPFMSIYTPAKLEDEGGSKALADRLIDLVEGIVRAHPDKFTLASSADDVERAFADKRVALLLGMENGSPIEGNLANLDHFHARGVRYITLCHSKDNHICDSSYDERHTHGGLTPFGEQVVERMNDLGIMVDVSHISDDAFWDVMEVTRAPVIASHSSLRYFTPGFERNISDEMVRRVGQNDGVVQINFGSYFVTEAYQVQDKARSAAIASWTAWCEEHGVDPASEGRTFAEHYDEAYTPVFADVTNVADHIDRVVALAGVDHVGFGSDYDGVGDSLPTGLKDVSEFPNLIAELLRRGYTDADIEKICSGNVLRVMRDVERLAR
jgi:membrane dipeptidase